MSVKNFFLHMPNEYHSAPCVRMIDVFLICYSGACQLIHFYCIFSTRTGYELCHPARAYDNPEIHYFSLGHVPDKPIPSIPAIRGKKGFK